MLLSREQFVNQFAERINATKKVSQARDVKETLERIYYVIQYFNSLEEFTLTVGSRPLSDIIIADEWKDFILPESVRMDPTDLKTNNLRPRLKFEDIPTPQKVEPKFEKSENGSDGKMINGDEVRKAEEMIAFRNSLEKFSPEQYYTFINDQARVRSYFKADLNSNTTTLATLRTNKSLADVIPIMAVRIKGVMRCRSLDEPYMPIELREEIGCLYRTDYFNVDFSDMWYDYMCKKVIG